MSSRFFFFPLTLCITTTSLLAFPMENEVETKRESSVEEQRLDERDQRSADVEQDYFDLSDANVQETVRTVEALAELEKIKSVIPILNEFNYVDSVMGGNTVLLAQNDVSILKKPFILNQNENDLNVVRLFIPASQGREEGSIVVPFVIPATTKADTPIEDQDGKKKFIRRRAPEKTPTPKENEEIREFFHDALLFCFKNEDSEKLRQKIDTLIASEKKESNLTPEELSHLVSDLASKHPLPALLAAAEQEIATQTKTAEPFFKEFNDHAAAKKEINHFSNATINALENYHDALKKLPQLATQAALRTSAAAASSLAAGLLAHFIMKQIANPGFLSGAAAITFRPLERELDLKDVESWPTALGTAGGLLTGHLISRESPLKEPSALQLLPQVGALLGGATATLLSYANDRSQSKSTLLRKSILSALGARPWNPYNQIGVYSYYGWKAGDYFFSAGTACAALEKSFNEINLAELKNGLTKMKTAQASDLEAKTTTTSSSFNSSSSNSNELPAMEEGNILSPEKIKSALTFLREQRITKRSPLIQDLEEKLEILQQSNWLATWLGDYRSQEQLKAD